MQNSNLVQETQILSKLLLVDLNVSIWSGRKKLRAEDLGVDLNLPPSELASLGSKRITDPDARHYRVDRWAGTTLSHEIWT